MLTPSRFEGDPLGYAGNQCGHGVIGAVAALAVMTAGVHHVLAAPLASLLYWVKIEWLPGQVRLDWADSFDDTVHAWLGAAVFVSAGFSFHGGAFTGNWTAHAALALWGAFMGWQMWRRWR